MSFARKIRYCAGEFGFVALVLIASKKGGSPIKFVLYNANVNQSYNGYEIRMIEYGANDEKVAMKDFPYGPVVYEEPTELQKQNPDIHWSRQRKDFWKETTGWLWDVAVGGGYQVYRDGDWVRVGRPRRWKDRRKNKNKVLKFGELAHIYMMHEKILENLQSELCEIESEIDENGFDPILEEEIFEEKDAVEDKISQVREKLGGLKEEMKYVYGRKEFEKIKLHSI